MKCGRLKEGEKPECSATDTPYQPSQFELEEYCRTSRYRVCPFYRVRKGTDSGATKKASTVHD